MQNTSSTKIPIQFQGGMAGSFGINPPLGLLNVSGNNLSDSFSDHNNGKSQDPISFLSSDRKDLSALQNRPSIEGKSPENFEMRGSAVQNSRTEIGPVSDYSARNSAKSPQNQPRIADSTQYFIGGGTEAKGLSKAFTSISKDISENHTRKSSRNKEVQKSCVISSFMPSEIEFDGIRLSPDSRRRESKKSTVSSRDIPSQSDLDSDLISRLDTDRFYADKKMGTKRKSPMKEEYSTGKYHEGYHHTRGNKSVVPSVSDGDYLLDQAGNLNYNKAFEGVPTFKQNTEKKGGYNEASEKKARNERLEAKFENMESLMQQMKVFQEKLYQNYKEAKDEVQKEAVEKLNIINNLSQDNSQSEKLRIKINELQKQVKVLTDENHHLKDSNQKKTDVIGKLEDQVKAARSEIAILKEKHEAKIESLMVTIKKLEKENLDPSHNREKSRGGDVHYKRDLRINTSDLMDKSREDRSSYKERDTTETSMESKHILRERFSLDNNDERMYQIQKELNKYRDEIEFLRRENKKLRTELHGNATHGRRSADLRSTVQPFENLLDNSNNLMDNKKLPDANMMFKVLTDISIEVEVENIAGIYPKVKEIQEENRTNKKFVDSFLDLVYRCSPSGSFEKRPNLKQAWKWMKRLMEEYMEMRKEGKEYPTKEDNTGKEMKEIASCLGVKTKDGIMDKIRELMSENSLMGKVISKMKSVYSIELSVPLGELDKRLELAMTTNGRMVNKQESRYTNLPLKMDNH